jgi:hypothetical protein
VGGGGRIHIALDRSIVATQNPKALRGSRALAQYA